MLRTGRFRLTEEQAFTLADEKSPAFLPGAFQVALAATKAVPKLIEAFRTGEGMGWHEHDHELFHGTERFFRPGYAAHLVSEWIPALSGVEARLKAGGRVADVGCGHGASTVLMAQAYPKSTFVGYDYHEGSIQTARERARESGVADRVKFEVAQGQGFSGDRIRLGHFFRLPARYGRSGRRGAPRSFRTGARGRLDDRRAFRERSSWKTISIRSAACFIRPRRCLCTPASLSTRRSDSRWARKPERRA